MNIIVLTVHLVINALLTASKKRVQMGPFKAIQVKWTAKNATQALANDVKTGQLEKLIILSQNVKVGSLRKSALFYPLKILAGLVNYANSIRYTVYHIQYIICCISVKWYDSQLTKLKNSMHLKMRGRQVLYRISYPSGQTRYEPSRDVHNETFPKAWRKKRGRL